MIVVLCTFHCGLSHPIGSHGPVAAVFRSQNIKETPEKGKRRSNFMSGSGAGALESAMQRHLSEQQEQDARDRTQAAEMELRKLELDREARGIMRLQKKERSKLKQELLGQMEAREAARVIPRLIPYSSLEAATEMHSCQTILRSFVFPLVLPHG